MMEGWKEYKLRDLADAINRGITPKYVDANGYIVINQKCIRNNFLSFSEARLTSKLKKITVYKKVNIGDVLVNSTGTGTLGRTAFVKKLPIETTTVDTHVTIVRPNKLVDNRFLGYNLGFQEPQIENYAKGATNQQELGRDDLGLLKIHLPPLPTQRKIAKILSAYDDLIENNLKRIKLLEEMAQKTYEEWFVRMKFPGHENAVFDKENGLPEGWKKVKLGEVCILTMGQSPKSEFYNTEKKGLPFHQGVKDYGNRFPTNTMWSTNGNRVAEKGTVLFSVRAPVGRLNIALEKIILGRGLASISYKNNWNGFLYYQLKQIFFEDNLMGGGAIFNSVTKNDMLRIELIEGDEETMKRFNKIAEPIDKNIENLHTQNQRLKEARDILLPRLMTGMIDVEKI